jgi:hypothetical protein
MCILTHTHTHTRMYTYIPQLVLDLLQKDLATAKAQKYNLMAEVESLAEHSRRVVRDAESQKAVCVCLCVSVSVYVCLCVFTCIHTGAAHGDTRAADGAGQLPARFGAGTPARFIAPGVKRDLK